MAGSLRVLMVSHAYPPVVGGVESHVADVSSGLTARGHGVICAVGGRSTSFEQVGTVAVYRFPEFQAKCLISGSRGHIGRVARLGEYLFFTHRPDVVHFHNAHHFSADLAAGLFQARAALPISERPLFINTVHDHVGNAVVPDVLNDFQWDVVLYVSESARTVLPSSCPSVVRHLGIDLEHFSPDAGQLQRMAHLSKPIFFHPARLLQWKGVEFSLAAFVRLRAVLGSGTLVMIASTDIVEADNAVLALRSQLEETASREGIREFVHFLQFSRNEMPLAYCSADVVWYPTIGEEPFGLVPLEAAACRVPVIVTPSGGMRETVLADRTAAVVPKCNSRALADRSIEILNDHRMRARLIRSAAAHVRQFDLQRYIDDLADLYHTRRTQLGGADCGG